MDFAVLLVVERCGPDVIALVTDLEAGGVTAIYEIPIGSQAEPASIKGILPVLLPAQPGKTAAVACGLQAVYDRQPGCPSIVLVDTHHCYQAEDILTFARAAQAQPGCLVVAERSSNADNSFLARMAGSISHRLVQFFLGVPIDDLHSGLLSIPSQAVPVITRQAHVQQNDTASEFELQMMLASKRGGFRIHSYIIKSVSTGQAPGSRRIFSSMGLYFVLARYISTSLLTAIVDNLVFILCYPLVHNLLVSIYMARLVAIVVNYFLLRKVVFYSSDKNARTFPRYVAVVLVSGLVASLMIDFFNAEFHIGIVPGKIIAELLLYLVNFAILNKLVFVHKQPQD